MQNQFTKPSSRVPLRAALASLLLFAVASCGSEKGTPSTPEKPAARTAVPAAPIEASRAAPLPQVELAETPNILLISIDTLRADHLSIYGYPRPTSPAIDRHFKDAILLRRAYSTEANTSPSVVSMLTGLYPSRHRVRLFYQRIPAEVPVLSDFLAAAGYETAAVVSNVVLTDEAIGLSTRFDSYDDFVDEREENLDVYERRASRTTDAGLAWLTERRDPKRPHFLWLHYIDPHGPYQRPEEARTTTFDHESPQPIDLNRVVAYQRNPDVDDGAAYIDRYDEEIAYVDAEIGRLLDAYDELGLGAEAIVVLTADHGENLIEHDVYFNHGHQVWNSIMHVPWMIRIPGRPRAEVAWPVSLADLTPTLLDLLHYPLDDTVHRFDGLPLSQREPHDAVSLEASGMNPDGDKWVYRHHRALVSGNEKWFTSVDRAGQVTARGRFDLSVDPDENAPIAWHFGGKGNELLGWFESDPDPAGVPAVALKGQRLDGPKVAPGRTPDQIRALRALGYVE